MANDEGLIAQLEQWFADTLKALLHNGEEVFKTAEVWKHQTAASKSGLEAFGRYTPFAFVSYSGADAAREGGYDLRQVINIAILIGVKSRSDGVARIGDANHLGISKIRDLVIAAFDRQHPGAGLKCDEIYYTGEVEVLDSSKRYAVEMKFETSYLTINN